MQKSLKQDNYLWKLFNIENDIEKANEDLSVEEDSLKEIVRELETYEDELKKKSKEQAGYMKEIQLRRRKIAEKQSRLDKVSVFYRQMHTASSVHPHIVGFSFSNVTSTY